MSAPVSALPWTTKVNVEGPAGSEKTPGSEGTGRLQSWIRGSEQDLWRAGSIDRLQDQLAAGARKTMRRPSGCQIGELLVPSVVIRVRVRVSNR